LILLSLFRSSTHFSVFLGAALRLCLCLRPLSPPASQSKLAPPKTNLLTRASCGTCERSLHGHLRCVMPRQFLLCSLVGVSRTKNHLQDLEPSNLRCCLSVPLFSSSAFSPLTYLFRSCCFSHKAFHNFSGKIPVAPSSSLQITPSSSCVNRHDQLTRGLIKYGQPNGSFNSPVQ